MSNSLCCVTTRFITGNTCTGTAATTGVDLGTMFVPRSYFTKYGELWAWGSNIFGNITNTPVGPGSSFSSPVQALSKESNWKDINIAGGPSNSFGIKTDGTLWNWGRNNFGDNANSFYKSSPVQTIAGGTNWCRLSTSTGGWGAIKTDGTLWVWGTNTHGRLGTNKPATFNESSPVQTVAGGTNWCFFSQTLAIKTDGTLWMLGGRELYGALGNDQTASCRSSPIQTISGGTNWKTGSQMSNTNRSFAIKSDGTLWGWGINEGGALGNQTTLPVSSPVQTVAGGTNWRVVSTDASTTAAIKTDGTLWMWGSASNGTLGTNSIAIARSSPVQTVAGGTNWLKVKTFDTCMTGAIKTDGTLWIWGRNLPGSIGDNSSAVGRSSPVQTIAGGTNWRCIAIGGSTSETTVLALRTQACETTPVCCLWLWGSNNYGQLGNNTTIAASSPIQTIAGGSNWKHINASELATVGIKTDGTLWTWGRGFAGILGNNAVISRSSPVQTIAGGTNWSVVSGSTYTIGSIKADGTLWVWGSGGEGVLGNNSTVSASSPVQTIGSATNWRTLSISASRGSATKTDGTLWTWGCGANGQLGNDATTSRSSPVQTIAGGTNWHSVASTVNVTAAIKTDGTLWTWGCNSQGYLGDNSTIDKSSPVQTIGSATNWKTLSSPHLSGRSGTIAAIKTDGTLWVWGGGGNFYGQLGTGEQGGLAPNARPSSPVQTVAGGSNWRSVAAGKNAVAAVKTDGTLWTWGRGVYLGHNSTTNQSSPIQTIAGGTNWRSVSLGVAGLGGFTGTVAAIRVYTPGA